MFRIRPITRASSTLEGHSEAVLSVAFSPDGSMLASGSGDTTVRVWDLNTETPLFTCGGESQKKKDVGHKHWVLFVAFSPDCTKIASGSMDNNIAIWNPENGKQLGSLLKGHKSFITSISWEPFLAIKDPAHLRMASSSKDQTIRIWDTGSYECLKILSSHTASVTKVLWGGEGFIYSACQDRTVKVWESEEGAFVSELKGHAHWVNTLALSTDYVLRTGCYDPQTKGEGSGKVKGFAELKKIARERYEKVRDVKGEKLVSGSDDFTMIMW